MADLYVATGIIWAVSLLIYFFTLRLARSLNKASLNLLCVTIVVIGIAHWFWLRDETWLATIMPYSSLVVLGNWGAPLCAALAATAFLSLKHQSGRRYWPVLALAATGAYSTIQPITGVAPQCRDEWSDGICLQSTNESCTAACAATLLKHHGIASSEAELTELCLTRKGTTWQGLYRGLSLKCADSKLIPQVDTVTTEELLQMKCPIVISVGIPASRKVASIYSDQYGWPVGRLHSVVLFGPTPGGLVEIGDPSVGSENWTIDDLQVLFRGTAVWLSTRP